MSSTMKSAAAGAGIVLMALSFRAVWRNLPERGGEAGTGAFLEEVKKRMEGAEEFWDSAIPGNSYGDFRETQCFQPVTYVSNEAMGFGLETHSLQEYLKLQLRSRIPEMPLCGESSLGGTDALGGVTAVWVNVHVVRHPRNVAGRVVEIHTKFIGRKSSLYLNAPELSPTDALGERVRHAIRRMVTKFALVFFVEGRDD